MNLPYSIHKINFVICIFKNDKDENTGAIIVLHYLAFQLANRGHNVYIFCDPIYPHENIFTINSNITKADNFMETLTWEPFTYNNGNTVSIYYNSIGGNIFNTTNVVRWILYHNQKEIEDSWSDTDVCFNLNNFKTYYNNDADKLSVIDYKSDIFFNENRKNRKGFCHIIHKNTPPNGEFIFNEINSTNITNWKEKGYSYLQSLLNSYEYMVTYDHASFYTIAAIMCGCKVIILNPNGNSYEALESANTGTDILLPLEFRLNFPIFMFGVAYGWDDIQWANDTIDLVPPYIEKFKEYDSITIDRFVKYWENKLNIN